MIYYDGIDVSERIDVNKTSKSQACGIYHDCCFFNKGFKFQPNVCNRCQDLLMMPMNLGDIIILNIKNADYCCIVRGISKSEPIKLMQNIDLTNKSGTL